MPGSETVPNPKTDEKNGQNGTAKRIRHASAWTTNRVIMETVVCDQCGACFEIGHAPAFQNAGLAARQAAWLAEQLVWDHIQEAKHRGTQYLPALHEMK